MLRNEKTINKKGVVGTMMVHMGTVVSVRLREVREQHGMSQQALGARLGQSVPVPLYGWEVGDDGQGD